MHSYSPKTSLPVLAALCVLPAAVVNDWLLYSHFELKRSQAEQGALMATADSVSSTASVA